MALLIDGFNLIYKFPHLEELMYLGELNKARAGLLDILNDYKKIKKKEKITVVFDGKKNISDNLKSERIAGIPIFYSLDLSADYIIKQFVKKDKNPKMITVITSDKEIIFYIKRFNAKNIKSEIFARDIQQQIEESNSPKIPEKDENPILSEDEINFWEKLFTKK